MTCPPLRGPPDCHTNSCWGLLCACPTVSSQHLCMEGSDVPILQTRKLRLREML